MKKDDIHKRYPDYLLKLMLRSIRVASAGAGAIDHDNSGVSSHLSSQQPQRYKSLQLDGGISKARYIDISYLYVYTCVFDFQYLNLQT